jgi:hypothetical protein
MKPHVKNTAETTDTTTESTSMFPLHFRFFSSNVFRFLGDGKNKNCFYEYYNNC